MCKLCGHEYNLRVGTQDCSCECHISDTLAGDFSMPELMESTWDAKTTQSSKCSLHQNRFFGDLAELYSQVDFKNNGFRVDSTNGKGFDYIATNAGASLTYVVEVKYNRSRLSKLQRKVQCQCKRYKINYFVYRVTKEQLSYWLMRYFF